MDTTEALTALGALAQESRLAAFRLLVAAGPDGLAAGEIARRLEVPHNTLSSHLNLLASARLVRSRRNGRSILYSLDLDGTRALLKFLVQDCCEGRPDLCGPLLTEADIRCAVAEGVP